MKLIYMQIKDYLDVLKSHSPTPGGGSVSALSGAQGVALILMVLALTAGKEKYKEYESVHLAVGEKAESLLKELTEAVDKDTEAFASVMRAYKMPKDTEEEKAARKEAIAEGTLASTKVPFRTMELGYEGLLLSDALRGKINPNAASDLGVAALNLLSCVKGAWLNVKTNLPGIKDKGKAEEFSRRGQDIAEEAEKIARDIYGETAGLL